MRTLSLHFNEFSSKCTVNEVEVAVREAAKALFVCLRAISNLRPDVQVVMHGVTWSELVGPESNRLPLRVWLQKSLQREQFLWLLGKLRHETSQKPADIDVHFNGETCVGLLFAHLTNAWALSLPAEADRWESATLEVIETRMDARGELASQSHKLKHLSREHHVTHWRDDLRDYGHIIADNNKICSVEDFVVVMYPNDHGYPHVHLVDPRTSRTFAKYRVDVFERMEGRPQFDSPMRELIRTHSDLFQRSWERCKSGGHPFQLELE